MNTNEEKSGIFVNPQELEIATIEVLHGVINVIRLPNNMLYLEVSEVANITKSPIAILQEFAQDTPREVLEKYPILQVENLQVCSTGVKRSNLIALIPVELAYGFWLNQMITGNHLALELVISLTVYLMRFHFDNNRKKEQ